MGVRRRDDKNPQIWRGHYNNALPSRSRSRVDLDECRQKHCHAERSGLPPVSRS